MSGSIHVLIVDDEPGIRRALRASLTAGGFTVEESADGEEALVRLHEIPADLVLLDANMPGMGGIEACRRIRFFAPNAGIIMVTVRDAEEDVVDALESGADDYITKPFRLRELLARMQSVIRRTRNEGPAGGILRAGALELDLQRRTVIKAGEEIHLSPLEFCLLRVLMQQPDVPMAHSKLLQTVWGPEYGSEVEYLRTYIRTLRKKVEDDPSRPEYILTEPWIGYRFRDPSAT